jgi:hypothetical protein
VRAPLLAALLGGCVTGPGGQVFTVVGDHDVFIDEVQPVLAARCSNPACHGTRARPLALYATGLHREDPDDTWLDTPLTDDELWANHLRIVPFVAGAPQAATAPLLARPLDPDAGGSGHGGGVQFFDPDEPEFIALQAWVSTALEEDP